MKAVQDFNYKVALSSGLKHLQGGKLRQAEEQFRYLVEKFPRADGGHRGLARVYLELGDRAAALSTLRDGAALIAKGGDRALGIAVLQEAVKLDPLDLTTHRRLAAALALVGDQHAAAAEHVRFVNELASTGDEARAKLEVEYAIETLGAGDGLADLASRMGVARKTERPVVTAPAPAAAGAVMSTTSEAATTAAVPSVEKAATTEVDAAVALLSEGKLHAASDLLLGAIAAGTEVHRAERELIPITRALGRHDLAEERAALLEQLEAGG